MKITGGSNVRRPRQHGDLVIKSLFCEYCHLRRDIPRASSRNKSMGHKKHMFCPRCNRVVAFIEEVVA